ncbi:MAG: YebC/PmpR family DNA-binding transcriptional regulator [Chloroflexi bacterium]|nr:YebC/PmpR family DNA-binding transcriptional regulator [Chloroflexota bacterium]
MSGHSKWATIKRSKGVADTKRGALFTKLGHEIAIAAREGGSDPDSNFRLRLVLDKARQANMPKDNVERAIARGAGELKGSEALQEAIFEGYGPGGSAIMLQTLSDNRNRTVSEVRRAFERHGGNLGSDGSVAWMFSRRGQITVDVEGLDPDDVAMVAIDAGAEDVDVEDNTLQIYTDPKDLKPVQEALVKGKFQVIESQLAWIPQNLMPLDEKDTVQTLKLVDALDELDDVTEVYNNIEITDEALAKYQSEAA